MNGPSSVVVLAGGLSHEREVSLRSGRRVAQALRGQGLDVIETDADSTLVDQLERAGEVVVFPLLHGEAGEDGSLREVLSLLDVPFVGAVASASRMTFDKSIATRVIADAGVPTPAQIALPHETFRELGAASLVRALGDQLGFPMMVKPAKGGSALGCTKVTSAEQLPAAMVAAYAYGQVAVVESFVDGTEITVAVIDRGSGPEALPAVQIQPESGIYDYAARYTAGRTRFICPAQLPDEVADRAADTALTVHRLLGLADLSRTDLIVAADGRPYFLEANVAPGMTETSALPLAVEAAGWDLGTISADLVRNAWERGVRTSVGSRPGSASGASVGNRHDR
ncbi:D-alanine--D-alanine ligase family protein [Microlunatus soli]|uniref:D-alanine--D-alanine ligase n=1 Tax=Microlunatus soli TaxID=630515 RepID=A0A1H1ULD3_9ACTN|nr:D-alanine--D-alanine ligase [Microlunatus soli]SDS73026.1 D-alanine-D-alanine ligase [Microlunatus soli]